MSRKFGIYGHNEIEKEFVEQFGVYELENKIKTIEYERIKDLLEYESKEWTLMSYYSVGKIGEKANVLFSKGEEAYVLFRSKEDLTFIRNSIKEIKYRLEKLHFEKELESSHKELINKRIENAKREYDLILKARNIQSRRILNSEEYYTIEEILDEGVI